MDACANPSRSTSLELGAFRGGLLIFLLTLAAYLPAMGGGYIWDDDAYVTENPALRGVAGLRDIWLDPAATPQYYPLVHTTFWVEYHLWGLLAKGYHTVNVLLHVLGALLLWAVMKRLGIGGAWLIASVFALHPVHVESVAWITERKNVLSGVFYLGAMLAYFKFLGIGSREDSPKKRNGRAYCLAMVLFVCALLSKTVTCTLPAALALLIWFKRGRLERRDWLALAPMFLLGFALGLNTVYLEKEHVGARGVEWSLSPIERFAIAGRAIVFYLGKLIWPTQLTFTYPRWEIHGAQLWPRAYPLGVAAAAAGLWLSRKKIGRGPFAAAVFFILTLGPALGFVDIYPFRYSFVADHFQYLASMGPIALVIAAATGGLRRLTAKSPRCASLTAAAVATIVLLALATMTWRQSRIYRDEETLWVDTLAKNPGAIIAYTNLGTWYGDRGEYRKTVDISEQGLDRAPRDPDLWSNLGGALMQLGKNEQALEALRRAEARDPDNPWTLNNIGLVQAQLGRTADAIATFRKAIRLHSIMPESYNNLATTLASAGRMDEAVDILKQGLKVAPEEATLRHNLEIIRSGRQTAPAGSSPQTRANR